MRIRPLLLASLSSALIVSSLQAATVTTSGRQLIVNGQAFTVKGVNYSPAPIGYSVAGSGINCLGPYHWWLDRPTYIADFPQIHSLGANTIRTFDLMNSTATTTQVLQTLDAAQANGLYVIMGYFVSQTAVIADAGFQARTQAEFLAAVSAYKSHPAVLMWQIGNENNLNNGNTNPAWYALIETMAQQAKALDPFHAITTAEGECQGADCFPVLPANQGFTFHIGDAAVGANDAAMPFLDVWSINIYRGRTFQGEFQTLVSSTTKPVLVSEFGKDAYRDSSASEDQDTQASYISSQWQEISANLSATSAGSANLAGGAVFEWSDEWWKDNGDDCITHGTQVVFHRLDDTTDPNYQDEWFGITAVAPSNPITNPHQTVRVQRKAFSTLQAFWNPGARSAAAAAPLNFFADTVRNYPNPFPSGTAPTKFVANVNDAGTLDIRIYDASGQFVVGLPVVSTTAPGRYEVQWDGKNRQGEYVSSGLYFAKIEGKSAQHSDHQFRRVVAVK
jgi:hypothetical protein